MSNWGLVSGANALDSNGATPATSLGTAVATFASANKGNWVTLVAATATTWRGFWLQVNGTPACSLVVDLALGAAGAEVIIVPDLLLYSWTRSAGHFVFIPVEIPAGARVSARIAAGASAAQTFQLTIHGNRGGPLLPHAYQKAVSVGITNSGVATLGGTTVDAGATANTLGWVELTASTPHAARALLLTLTGTSGSAPTTATSLLVSLAVGPSGSEASNVILGPLYVQQHNSYGPPFPAVIGPIPCDIPTGSRLAVGLQASSTDAIGRAIKAGVTLFD